MMATSSDNTTTLSDDCIDGLGRWLIEAETEAMAYHRAVQELYGPEAAQWAIEDWLKRVECMSWPPKRSRSVWREHTVLSTISLASFLIENPYQKEVA